MGVIAIAVRHLIAAGVTGDALVTAIEQLEAVNLPVLDTRSAAAKRQERYRNRHKASPTVTDVTVEAPQAAPEPVQPETVTDRNIVTSCNAGGTIGGESSLLPDLGDSGKEDSGKVIAREARRGTRIPDGFRPSDAVLNDAQITILTVEEIDRHIARMTDWAIAKGTTMKNWDSFARNWLRKEADTKRDRQDRKPTNGYNTRDSIAQAFDYIDRRDRKDGRPENLELLPRFRETTP